MNKNIKNVIITEVGTRDGFQSEKKTIDTQDKILLIDDLVEAGFKRIEFSSFVSPKAIPQLADADQVIKQVKRKSDVTMTALVPNLRGAIRAVESKIDEIVVFLSASESHNKKNLNRTINESLIGFEEVIKLAQDSNIPVHGDISTAFGCPFEGEISVKKIVEITKEYKKLGFKGVTLGDTTGMATPPVVTKTIREIKENIPDFEITPNAFKLEYCTLMLTKRVQPTKQLAVEAGLFRLGAFVELLVFLVQSIGFVPKYFDVHFCLCHARLLSLVPVRRLPPPTACRLHATPKVEFPECYG